MAELLDLRGERAAAAAAEARVDVLAGAAERGHAKAPPFHRRIAIGPPGVEQVAVLDEAQGMGDQGRDRGKARVSRAGVARGLERGPRSVAQHQPGLRLLVIDRVAAGIDEAPEQRRLPRLTLDDEMAGREPVDEGRELGIAKTPVIGAGLGKADRRARARLDRERHVPDGAGDEERLQRRGIRLIGGDPAQQDEGSGQGQAEGHAIKAPRGTVRARGGEPALGIGGDPPTRRRRLRRSQFSHNELPNALFLVRQCAVYKI